MDIARITDRPIVCPPFLSSPPPPPLSAPFFLICSYFLPFQLVPTMREVLRHYSRAEYRQCLSLLQEGGLRRDLLLDMHLHAHVPALLDMIRDRCIVQYFRPYSSVSLERMGRVFGCTAREMEGVVAKLLSADAGGGGGDMSLGEGRARINAHDGTLSVEGPKSAERRARRRARVMAAKMGRQFTREAEGVILREFCNCMLWSSCAG